MLGGKLAVLVVIAGYQASATESTERRTRKMYDINYRQVGPMMDVPQPTTSMNWEPHPAGGPPANNPVNPHPPPPPPPPPAPPPVSTPHPLISPLPPSTASPSAPTTAILALTSTSTSAPSNSSPATDIISITALPPLDPSSVPTPITYPKKKPPSEQAFKLVYLAPVFVVLGILWGSITAWVTYGCLTRRPRVRDGGDELVGGPRYVPAEREEGGGRGEGRGDLEGGALLKNDDGMQEAVFEWPDLREKAGVEIENENERAGSSPFLAQPHSTPAKPTSMRTKSARSTATAYSDATYVLDTYDEGGRKDVEDVPWESLRHQSIRRGILEQVQREGHRIDALRPATGSLLRNAGAGTGTGQQKNAERRPTRHTRTDSDLLVGDVDLPVLLPDRATSRSKESTSTTTTATATRASGSRPFNHRANSMHTALSGDSSITTSTGDKTQWRPGAGFRIVPESPAPSREPTPTPSLAPMQLEETYPAISAASEPTPWRDGRSYTDRYTPLPARHTSRSNSNSNSNSNSANNSPVKSGYAPAPTPASASATTPDRTRHAHPNPHASVLPQSPPQITSPLLENILCFTPAPASPPRTWIGSRTPGRTPATAPASAPTKARSRNRNGDRSRAPPPPPFPSPADINSPRPDMHMYRSRLVKAPPPLPLSKPRPVPMPMVAPNASSGSGSGSTMSYTRDAEGRVMRRVEDIVERGLGTRERAL